MAKTAAKGFFQAGLRYPLEAAGLYVALSVFRCLPVERASNFGAWLGRSIGPRLAITRRARRNLQLAFPETSEAEREAIVLGMWDNLGRVVGEYCHLKEITAPESGRVLGVGFEHTDPLRRREHAGITVSGHLANWEILPVVAAREGLCFTSIVREPNNPLVRRTLASLRGVSGGKRAPKGREGAKQAIRVLKAGETLGLLVDQKMNDGISVPFFGQPAMTAPAVAQLALRFGCPVYPVRIERLGPARFRMTCYPALSLPDSGERQADVQQAMETINGMLETWIRERPAEWLWLHRRWPKKIDEI